MNTNTLTIETVKTPSEAPQYHELPEDWKSVDIQKAIVVGQGTVAGRPTVDFQMEDADGNKYIGMLTGALILSLAQVVITVEDSSDGEDRKTSF